MIRAMVFDFGQTLVDSSEGFRAAEKEAQRKAFASLCLTEWDAFLAVYRGIRSGFHARSVFSRKRILEALFVHYGQHPEDDLLEKWENDYWDRVKTLTRIFPEAQEVLTVLGKRYRLALITNTQGQKQDGQHRLSNYPGLERFFEVIVVAGEGGIPAKPDPEPFRICLGKLNLDPADTIYVGDDWRIDVCGSKAVGMQPVWLKHRTVERHWPAVEIDVPVIDSLDGLVGIEKMAGEATS